MPKLTSRLNAIEICPDAYLTAIPVPIAATVRVSGSERLRRMAEGGSGMAVQRQASTGWRLFMSDKPGSLGKFLGVATPDATGGIRLGALVEPSLAALGQRLATER